MTNSKNAGIRGLLRGSSQVGGGLIAAIALASPSAAQEAGKTSDTPPAASMSLEEVVVTAQKRSERLQDVPVPVTAIGAESLAERNQLRLQDYFASVPGLNVNSAGNGQTSLSIRGVSTGGLTNATVGITVDDVPYGSSSILGYSAVLVPDIDPADLARVEILRGPQGTLYGASSIGGLVKYVTADPSVGGFRGRVQADLTNVGDGGTGYGVRGLVNVPLSDTAAVRLSGYRRRDAGFVDDPTLGRSDVNTVDVTGGRVSALWQPSDSFSLKLSALLQNTDGDGSSQVDVNSLGQPTLGELVHSRTRGTDTYELRARIYSATAAAKLGALDLTSVSSYGKTRYFSPLDFSASSYGRVFAPALFNVNGASVVNQFETEKYTQELRLGSPAGEKIEWLLGAFYTHEKTPAVQSINAIDPATGAVAGLLLASPFPTTYQEYAAFANLTVHFTDRFDVQLGARQAEIRQKYSEIDSGPVLELFGIPGGELVNDPLKTSDRAFTYLVTPRLKVSPDLMVYARIASGYRPGGPNPGVPALLPVASYEPDKTTNYELGMKSALLDHRLSLEASVYYIDWKDIQIQLTDSTTGFTYFRNAGKARSQGLELSLEARPATGLTVALAASVNDSKLLDDLPSGGAVASSGDRLPGSSRFTGSLSIDQEFPLGAQLIGFVGGTLSRVGEREGLFPQEPAPPNVRVSLPGYTLGDLRGGVRAGSWTATVLVSNVADERGVIAFQARSLSASRPTDPFYASYVRPRTYGLSIAKEF